MGAIAIGRFALVPVGDLARWSRDWAVGAAVAEPALVLGEPTEEATVLGAFQRSSELLPSETRLERRGSGGGAARVGPGRLWVQLRLPGPSSQAGPLLVASPDKLLNRYVRPLLAAVSRASGVPAHYFGRDWISAAQRPVALVAFAHEASTGHSLFEAIVGVREPFAPEPDRPSFRGKPVATLMEVAGRNVEVAAVADAVAAAYGKLAHEVRELDRALLVTRARAPGAEGPGDASPFAPAWAATCDEAIGRIGAGADAAGQLRLGGELMASRDAVERLERLVGALPVDASADDVGRLVDEVFTSDGAVLFGVRELRSIRDVLVLARQNMA